MIEATAQLCQTQVSEESPTNLDSVTPNYLFEVTVLSSETETADPKGANKGNERLVYRPDRGWTGSGFELSIEDRAQLCSEFVTTLESLSGDLMNLKYDSAGKDGLFLLINIDPWLQS